MTEETKKTFEDLGAAFDGVVDDEQPKEPETPNQVAEVELEKTEKEEIPVQETKEEQPEVVEDWESLGYPEFKGKSPKEIAAVLKQKSKETEYRDRLYGQQANEVGALRKEVEELKKRPVAEEKPEVTGLSEAEADDFQDLFRTDPAAAIDKYYGPQVEKIVESKMAEAVASGPINQKMIEQLDAIEMKQLRATHADFDEHSSEMTALDAKEALGPQRRPAEELYQLAKLWKSNDPLWQATYGMMARYQQMPFSEAHALATASNKAPAGTPQVKKDDLVKEVKDLQDANPKKTTKAQADNVKVYSDEDEAFDSITD
jgi:hypothetical protein